jgi:hypothetical protein
MNYDVATDAATFNAALNNLKFASYEDSLEVKYSQIRINISGVDYKASIIPTTGRGLKSFVDA